VEAGGGGRGLERARPLEQGRWFGRRRRLDPAPRVVPVGCGGDWVGGGAGEQRGWAAGGVQHRAAAGLKGGGVDRVELGGGREKGKWLAALGFGWKLLRGDFSPSTTTTGREK
jgi:hypothetical protein